MDVIRTQGTDMCRAQCGHLRRTQHRHIIIAQRIDLTRS
jgi:hypothetical protein